MKHTRIALVSYKSGFALLGLSSIVLEIITLAQRGVFNFGNFFSYFTVLANIFAAAVLITSAIYVYQRRKSQRLDVLRGAAALYMILTGVVFATLLSKLDPRLLTAVPWDNTVLHYIMPIVLLLDWFIHPAQTKFTIKHILLWLVFPTVYVVYTLVRGGIVGWYPYPFLNPANGGYGSILVVSFFIAIFTVSAGVLLARTVRSKSSDA